MSDSHRRVSTGGGSFHEGPFMAVIARIPAGTNFAATRIGRRRSKETSIQIGFAFSHPGLSKLIYLPLPASSGISSSQSSKRKPPEVNRKSFQDASSTAGVFFLHSPLDDIPIFVWSDLGRGFQADRTEHNHKEPLPDRRLAGGVAAERRRGGRSNGRAGGGGGRASDQQGRPCHPPQGQGSHPVHHLLSTPVEQDGKRFWILREEGSTSDQVQVNDTSPKVLLGPGLHPDLHQGDPWPVPLRGGGGVHSRATAEICEEKWTRGTSLHFQVSNESPQ